MIERSDSRWETLQTHLRTPLRTPLGPPQHATGVGPVLRSAVRALPVRALPLLTLLTLLLGGAATASAQPTFYVTGEDAFVEFHPETGIAVTEVDISIIEDPNNPTFPTITQSGFSLLFGVDPQMLAITAVVPTGPLAPICGDTWDYFGVEGDLPGCPGAVSVGVVFGFTCDVFPTYEADTPVVTATIEGIPAALLGAPATINTALVAQAGCGNPAVTNRIIVDGGVAVDATWLDSALILEPVPRESFIRGDCNADGLVDIADGTRILAGLFLGEGFDTCVEACEVHDDGGVPDVADAIALLTHLFSGGPSPAPPHPFCGGLDDQVPEECRDFPGCP